MSQDKFTHRSLVVLRKSRSTWEARRWGRKLVGHVLLDDAGYLVKGPHYYAVLGRHNSLREALDMLDGLRTNLPVAS